MDTRWQVALALCIAAIMALLVALFVTIETKDELMTAGTAAGGAFALVGTLALGVVSIGRKQQ